MTIQKRIKIIFEAINKATVPIQKTQKQLKQLELQTQAYQNVLANSNASLRKTKRFFRDNSLVMKNNVEAISQLTGKTRSLGSITEGVKKSTRGFKFEWLGIMFAGMALDRVFGGLIRKQLQLFGVSSVLGAMWTIVLLPIMEILVPILFKILDFFMNLSPSMKLAIGIFILIAATIGIILLVVGQVMLGVSSLAELFALGGAAIIMIVAGIILIIAGISLVIAGVIKIVKNWGNDWGVVVDGIIKVLIGLGLIILGIALIIGSVPLAIVAAGILIVAGIVWIVKKIVDNWEGIKTFFKNLWVDIKNIFKQAITWIKDTIKNMIPDWMLSLLTGHFNIGGSLAKGIGGLLGFQTGGIVPGKLGQPQLAVVHGGERITPVNGNNNQGASFSPQVTINANVSSNFDVRQIAEELNRLWAKDFERLSQGGF